MHACARTHTGQGPSLKLAVSASPGCHSVSYGNQTTGNTLYRYRALQLPKCFPGTAHLILGKHPRRFVQLLTVNFLLTGPLHFPPPTLFPRKNIHWLIDSTRTHTSNKSRGSPSLTKTWGQVGFRIPSVSSFRELIRCTHGVWAVTVPMPPFLQWHARLFRHSWTNKDHWQHHFSWGQVCPHVN